MPLSLHCGSNATTRDILRALPVPDALGPRHAILPFGDLVDLATDHITNLGGIVKDESFGVLYSPGNVPRRFFGLMEIDIPGLSTESFALQVGVRGSYDQSISAGLAVGSRVFVCDNLAFHGEIDIRTKQTTQIRNRLPGLIGQAVSKIPGAAEHQLAEFDRYRNTQITRRDGDAMLVEFVRRGALSPSQLGKALQEWDTPTFVEHAEDGFSLWRLHNAVTMAIKNPGSANALGNTWVRTRTMTDVLRATAANDQLPPPPDEILLAA